MVPAGNGTLVLGLWLGFRELAAPARWPVCPRSSPCRPNAAPPWPACRPTGPTAATGIAIAGPPRGGEVRAAVLASRGAVVTVSEEELESARRDLAGLGMRVEPTAAAAWAAARPADRREQPTVVVLSGAGG